MSDSNPIILEFKDYSGDSLSVEKIDYDSEEGLAYLITVQIAGGSVSCLHFTKEEYDNMIKKMYSSLEP